MADHGAMTELLRLLSVNFLALGQFELARGTLQELKKVNEAAASGVLAALIGCRSFPQGWLASGGVPSPAHLAWLASRELHLTENATINEVQAECALLGELAASLHDASLEQHPILSKVGDDGASRAGIRTPLQPQQRTEQKAHTAEDAEQSLPDRDSLACLLLNEPQVFRALASKDPSGATCRLLREQWEVEPSAVDFQRVCNILTNAVRTEDGDLLQKQRLLLDHVLGQCKAEGVSALPSQAHCSLWAAAVASGVSATGVLLQAAQDGLVASAAQAAASEAALSPPLVQLRRQLQAPGADPLKAAQACTAALFHHSRVTRTHALEIVAQEALQAAREQDMSKAAQVLLPFPALSPLLAVMAWDMHAGHAGVRQDALQRLWKERTRQTSRDDPQPSSLNAVCDQLSYQMHVAHVLAGATSGHHHAQANEFGCNYLLDRLAQGSLLQVSVDPALTLSTEDALRLIRNQPTGDSQEERQAMQHDMELLRMHLALQAALRCLERASMGGHETEAVDALEKAAQHMDSLANPFKKALFCITLASLLRLSATGAATSSLVPAGPSAAPPPPARSEAPTTSAPLLAARFVSLLQRHLPQHDSFLPRAPPTASAAQSQGVSAARQMWARKAARWHAHLADWVWRLQVVVQRVEGAHASWGDCVATLEATPAQLLDRCTQAGDVDLARQLTTRYSMTVQDTTSVELAAWLEGSGDALMDGGSSLRGAVKDALDFSLLEHKLSPLTKLLACLDVALTRALPSSAAKCVLTQAKDLAQQCRTQQPATPAALDKDGNGGAIGSKARRSSHSFPFKRRGHRTSGPAEDEAFPSPMDDWNDVNVRAIFELADSLVQQMQERQSQHTSASSSAMLLQAWEGLPGGALPGADSGPDPRAITALQAAIKDAHDGKRQFLSGKLHNLVKALAGRGSDGDLALLARSKASKHLPLPGARSLLGLGLAVPRDEVSPSSSGGSLGERVGSWGSEADGDGGGPASPLARSALLDTGGKQASLLSAAVHYVASIGDIMDEVDTTHTYNFFAILYQKPDHLLAQLVSERCDTDTASRAAELMGVDLTRQLLDSTVGRVLPPALAATTAVEQPRQPLEVEVAQMVARVSSQQALLAALVGSEATGGQEGDGEGKERQQKLKQLALRLAESFPVLHRWLLLRNNSPAAPIRHDRPTLLLATPPHTQESRVKRPRSPHPSDPPVSPSSVAERQAPEPQSRAAQSSEMSSAGPQQQPTPFELVDWDDEQECVARVREQVQKGRAREAVAFADRCLLRGAPDEELVMVVEAEAAQEETTQETRGGGVHGWQACMRVRDKTTAGQLALKHVRRWELAEGKQVLDLCAAHLSCDTSLRTAVLERLGQLERYQRVLTADPSLDAWQQVEDLYLSDPEGLALRLSSKGAVAAAIDVVLAARLPLSLRNELQSRQLASLMDGVAKQGSGLGKVLRFLRDLPEAGDAVAVVAGALPLMTQVAQKQTLVRYLLAHPPAGLSAADSARLRSLAVGLSALAALPLPWQQRCTHLAEHPALVLESLLMAQQFNTARKLLAVCPSLHNDGLIVRYADKALAPPAHADSSARHPLPPHPTSAATPLGPGPLRRSAPSDYHRSQSLAPPRSKVERAVPSALRSTSTSSGMRGALASPDGQTTPRRISWAAGTSTMWAAASSFTSRLLHQGGEGSESPRAPSRPPPPPPLPPVPPFQSAAWEAMSGTADGRGGTAMEASPHGRLLGDVGLTGDANKDDRARRGHVFEGAPSAAMVKALLPLCADVPGAVRELLGSVETAVAAVFGGKADDPAKLEHLLRTAGAYVQALQYLVTLLRERGDSTRNKALLPRLRTLLPQLEVVQALLGAGVPVTLSDLREETALRQLRDRLIQGEHFQLAHSVATKCGVAVAPVEHAWGMALLASGQYQQARRHLRAALELLPEIDRPPAVQAIVGAIEGAPAADVHRSRNLYSEMARSVAMSSEEAFSFDAYLNVLNGPTQHRPPVSRHSSGEQTQAGGEHGQGRADDGRADYLGDVEKDEALRYVQQYDRAGSLPFLFRHGHYSEACQAFLAALSAPHPSPQLPPSPPPSGAQMPRVASGSVDPLVSPLGSLDEVCELCVTYGAMPVLVRAIEEKSAEAVGEWAGQRSALLAKMAAFCETHRHFNHLYSIQLLQKDPVAAGLTCIQLFQNAATANEAVKHLEVAREHFDDGLLQRQVAPLDGGAGALRRGKDGRKSASAKLSEEEIIKLSTRVQLQAEVARATADSDGAPWQHSLFGPPGDPETLQRRTQVAEHLAERHFDLAFRVIYDFNLPAVATYAGAAASLAARRRSGAIVELVKAISGTIDEAELDQVVMAAVHVYATQHKEHPAALVDQLSNNHRKVLACVASGRLKSAFQYASRANNLADVQLVAHQARETGQLNVMDMCHQWMAKKSADQ